MSHPYRSAVIPAPVDEVWAVARRFNGTPAWHPVIEKSSLDSGQEGEVGAVRRLVLGDGGIVVERLLALDDTERRLTYTILQSPFAARNYVSTMHVAPITDSGETFMEWYADFDSAAADTEQLMGLFGDGVFGGGLGGLRDHLAG